MPGGALVTGHQIWTGTSDPAAQHLPTTLASTGEKEIKFKLCFPAKKGTLGTTFKFPASHHSYSTREAGSWVFNSLSYFPSVFPNLNHRYRCCGYKPLPCWDFT